MKRTLLLLLLLLAGNTAFAQDYAPLPDTGIRRYFTNAAGYLRGIRIDSVVQEIGYKRYVTFRTARGWKNSSELADSNGACWIGKNVRAYPNGDWQFPNRTGDTVIIKTGAALNESWSFYSDTTSRWFEAKVIAVDTQTVFGILDSVKIIQLTAKMGTTPLPADSITGFKILLSKAHGFAQVPDLYLFPYPDLNFNSGQRDYWYHNVFNSYNSSAVSQLVFKHIANWNPTARDLFSYGVGDIVYGSSIFILGTIKNYFLDTVVNKQEYPAYTDYTFNRWSWSRSTGWNSDLLSVQNGISSRRVDNKQLVDTTFMPEEYYPLYASQRTNVVYLRSNDTSFCSTALRIDHIMGDRDGLYVKGLIYPAEYSYKLGIGLLNYRQGNGDGGAEEDELLGYIRNGNSCKEISAVPLSIGPTYLKNSFSLYPQPATTSVYLQAPQLRYPVLIEIRNLQGQLLSTQQITTAGKSISTANLPAGLYLLSITGAGGNTGVQKLVIQN